MFRLGLIDRARQHLHMAGGGSKFNSVDVHCLENIEKHLKRCIEARKVGDWYKVIKESDAAVVAGADSAPQVVKSLSQTQNKRDFASPYISISLNLSSCASKL